MFERTLELHDSLHDAKCRSDECLDYVARVVMGNVVLPSSLTLRCIAQHNTFMDAVTMSETLDYGGLLYDNSALFGKDYRQEFMDGPAIPGGVELVDNFENIMRDKVKTHDERIKAPHFDGIELYSTKKMKDSLTKIFRVAAFCSKVRELYSGRAKLVMDVEHKTAHMLFKYKEVDRALGNKHVIVNETHGNAEHGINAETLNEWTFVQCEASVLDGMDHPGDHDDRPSGVASLPGSLVQVNLDGMSDCGVGRYRASIPITI